MYVTIVGPFQFNGIYFVFMSRPFASGFQMINESFPINH